MTTTFLSGETIHLAASDMTELVSGTATNVTAGATVIFSLEDQEGTVVATTTVTVPENTNNWGANLTAPTVSVSSSYFAKASATKTGAVWRARQRITVNPF